MCKLAVIIPLYNKESSIVRAIHSVLEQSVDFQQLIIIDDGSTDNSLDVAKQFQDKRISVISQTNQGVSVARNKGASIADVDYLCFLDADDQWEPHFLEEITTLIHLNKDASLFCARYGEISEEGQYFIGNLVGISQGFRGELPDFFTAYQQNRCLYHPSASCINVRDFKLIGGFPEGVKIGEDIYAALQLALSGPVMFSANKSSTVFRNAENRTNVREKFIIPYHVEYFLDPANKDILEKNKTLKSFLLYNTTIFGLYAAQIGDKKQAFKMAKLLSKQSVMHSIIVFLGACLPKCFIHLLKKLRNKKTLSYEN